MSGKSAKIAALIDGLQGRDRPAHYLGFFACFNRQLFYEAHDVLEELWLPRRRESDGNFYKGLIQLAGAFVHFKKDRLRPAGALLALARGYLAAYRPKHLGLDVEAVIDLIDLWSQRLATHAPEVNPFGRHAPPQLDRPAPAGRF